MKFSYNFLQSFFKKKLPPPKELANLLMLHFFEVDGVEKVGSDFTLDIDVLPSRAGDCFSHIGIAREIAAFTGMDYKEPEVKIKEKGESIEERVSMDVRGACSRYTLRVIDDVEVASSPTYIQKRLKTCGIKPINNVVDIANYVMLETGQPLHAFDAEKLGGEKIIVRYAKKREKIVTLDEKRYELQDSILVIADELSPIGIAGIKGGIVPEVDKETKKIFLEAANFDPLTIRRGSRNLKLRTDASLRFEHGISAELTQIAINRAASMIADIAGGRVVKGLKDYYPEKEEEKTVSFDVGDVRKVLGTDVSLKEIERILRALGFRVQRNQENFSVTVPYFRTDVSIKEDIIEEIGRIYGYKNIDPCAPKKEIVPTEKDENFDIENSYKDLWKSFGFSETYNYSFINEELSIHFDRKKLIELEKPVSLEFKYLRPSLLPGLIRNLAENQKNYEKIRIFEMGSVFYSEGGEKYQKKRIAFVSSADDFYSAKGKINLFLDKFFTEQIFYVESDENTIFSKKRLAKIVFGSSNSRQEELGALGEISSKIKEEMRIKGSVVIAELDLEKIKKFRRKTKTYEQIFRFPPSTRDVAVLVPKKTPYAEVEGKIKKEGGKMLRRAFLFDVYEGKEIPEGMKNLAFRLLFQAKNKTISSFEVNKLQEKIIKSLDGVSGWKTRSNK